MFRGIHSPARTWKRALSMGLASGLILSMTLVTAVSAHTATKTCEAIVITNTPAGEPADIYSQPAHTKIYGPVGNGTYSVSPGDYQVRWPLWDNDSHSTNLTVLACPKQDTSISTNASGSVVLGGTVSDTATLSGGDDPEPTGTITFKLYGPNDATCDGPAVFTSTKDVDGNGTYGSGDFTPTAAGTYRWIANYSGDAKNDAATGHCNDENEKVDVTKVHPSITTDASSTVVLGGAISDTATLAGGHAPTGTITFKLYGPNAEDCGTDPLFSSVKDVTGNGEYGSGNFTPSAIGTYRWIAAYSGDADNLAAAGKCNDEHEAVVVTEVKTPDLDVIKLVATGSDEFGPTSVAQPGDIVHFKISIHNTGNGDASGVDVTDDINAVLAHSTYNADCSDSCSFAGGVLSWADLDIDAGATEILTFSVTLAASFPEGTTHLPNVVIVTGPGSNCPRAEGDENCDTDTTVSASALTINKTNNAPIDTVELPGGGTADMPTADEGDTVTFTLHYTFGGDPVTNGVITDVIPAGLTYVTGSATTDGAFTVVAYGAPTHTLTWTAATVSDSGTLTYKAKVDVGASELEQPLTNVATIDSDQTPPDSDDSDVFVPVIPEAETDVPSAPPTDTLESTGGESGSSLPLVLAVLGVILVAVGVATPVPATVRRRNRR